MIFRLNNIPNGCLVYTKGFAQYAIAFSFRMPISYLLSLQVSEFGIWMQFTSHARYLYISFFTRLRTLQAPFTRGILHVIGAGTKTQMRGINAGRIIAGMQDMQTCRNISIGQSPSNTVCKTVFGFMHHVFRPKCSISISVNFTLPVPAPIKVRAIYFRPEVCNGILPIPFSATSVIAQRFWFFTINRGSSSKDITAIEASSRNFLIDIGWILSIRFPTPSEVHFDGILLACAIYKMLRINTVMRITRMIYGHIIRHKAILHTISKTMCKGMHIAKGQNPIAINQASASPKPTCVSLLHFSPKTIPLCLSRWVSSKVNLVLFHEFNYTTLATKGQQYGSVYRARTNRYWRKCVVGERGNWMHLQFS